MLTDVFVKSIDTHQHLHATSCHVYHSKISILYSQALRFNRTCSKNKFFNERCNKLVAWLKNRGYNEKLVRQQHLKARNYRRTKLLYSQREQVHRNKLVFKISYPIALKLHILSETHLLLHRIRSSTYIEVKRNIFTLIICQWYILENKQKERIYALILYYKCLLNLQ